MAHNTLLIVVLTWLRKRFASYCTWVSWSWESHSYQPNCCGPYTCYIDEVGGLGVRWNHFPKAVEFDVEKHWRLCTTWNLSLSQGARSITTFVVSWNSPCCFYLKDKLHCVTGQLNLIVPSRTRILWCTHYTYGHQNLPLCGFIHH